MKKYKFKFDKLVRDNISNILQNSQISVVERTLFGEDLIISLKNKLIEESSELKSAFGKDLVIEELADVLEVFNSLLKSLNITLDQVEQCRREKLLKNGGFESQNYIDYIEIEESNPILEKYISNPAKYCLIEE